MHLSPQFPEDREQKLERLIHQTLRELPAHRAPRSLESRVMAAIAAQAALPWWKKSFTDWPLAVRLVGLVALAGIMKVVLLAGAWFFAGYNSALFTAAFAGPLDWWHTAATVSRVLSDFGAAVWRSIPPLWLYGAAAIIAAAYATFFGLGAAAYRTLYAQHPAEPSTDLLS